MCVRLAVTAIATLLFIETNSSDICAARFENAEEENSDRNRVMWD